MFPRGQIFALDGQICPGLQEKEKHTGLGIIPLASINASKMTQAHAVVFYFTCNGHHPGECGRTRCRGGGIHPPGSPASVARPSMAWNPEPAANLLVKNCGLFCTTIALPEKIPEKTARKKEGKRPTFATPFAVFGEIRPPGLSRMIESDPNLMPFLSIKQSKFGLIQANCR